MPAPIIVTSSYVGTGAPWRLQLGFRADLFINKGVSQNACFQTQFTWAGGRQAFGNTAVSGSDGTKAYITDEAITFGTDASFNTLGTTYHYLAIKDNDSGILRTGNYSGYRSQTVVATGTVSEAVTMDLLSDSSKALNTIFIKRDAVSQQGVFAWSGFAKKVGATAVDNTLLTVNSDSSLSLSTDISVNQNDGGDVGEATNFFALFDAGTYWDKVDYVGTGVAKNVGSFSFTPAAAICIPQAAAQMIFNWGTMGASSADGGATALAANKITAFGSGFVTIGTDASVNTNGTTYTMIVFKSSAPTQIRQQPLSRRKSVQIRFPQGGTASRVDCGYDNSLTMSGAMTMEWIGAIAGMVASQSLMLRGGNASTGSRGTPLAASFNFGMEYTDANAGLEICTSDRFPSHGTGAGSVFDRWRTGIKLLPGRRYHIICTYDGVDKWVLYIDGVAVNWRRFPMSVLSLPEITATNGLKMSFGGRIASNVWAGSQNSNHAFGALYSIKFTPSQALNAYQRNALGLSISNTTSGLVESWAFTEGSGSTVAATVSASNNGTISGAGWDKG